MITGILSLIIQEVNNAQTREKFKEQLAILERILTLSGRKSKFFTNYCLKIARNRMKKAIIEWYNAFKMYNIAINIIEIRQNVSLL